MTDLIKITFKVIGTANETTSIDLDYRKNAKSNTVSLYHSGRHLGNIRFKMEQNTVTRENELKLKHWDVHDLLVKNQLIARTDSLLQLTANGHMLCKTVSPPINVWTNNRMFNSHFYSE